MEQLAGLARVALTAVLEDAVQLADSGACGTSRATAGSGDGRGDGESLIACAEAGGNGCWCSENLSAWQKAGNEGAGVR